MKTLWDYRLLEQQTRQRMETTLPAELQVLLELRFGISGHPKHSHRRIAKVLGVRPIQVRKAEWYALRAMRHGDAESVEFGLAELRVNRDPSPTLAAAVEKIDRLTPDLIAHLATHEDDLRKIPWEVLEHLVGEFLANQGFRDVRLVGRDPRTSADLYATWIIDPVSVHIRFFIEVKRWRERLGVTVINEVLGAMFSERDTFGWHAGMIIATGGFTDFRKYSPLEISLRGIELRDKHDLLRWLRGYRPNKNGLWLPAPPKVMPAQVVKRPNNRSSRSA